MAQFVRFSNGTWGRLAKVMLGLALIAFGLAVPGGVTGVVLAVVGLVLVGLGISGHCLLEPFARSQPRQVT